MARRGDDFQTIRSEGGLLPPDLLRRISEPKEKIPGTAPEEYGLPQGDRINEAITQSWNRLRRHWTEFSETMRNLPAGEAATGITNDRWSLPLLRELGFGLLPTTPGPEIEGRTYAINRFFGSVPIHLVGCGLSLDRRAAGIRGAAATNPHGLVQEFLNRAHGYLWGIVSNGLRFRILRDNQALSRQSYLEFDLEAMFSGEVFPDFVLLWLSAHATRFTVPEGGRPESCWLERWTKLAEEQGTRALESLKVGVEKALEILGQGFVGHPRNTVLRENLRSGAIPLDDMHGQLLRIVYRLIFLFVAEDRTLEGNSILHPRNETDEGRVARELYARNYSTTRLRELAARIRGSRHGDLWHQFNLLVGALSGDNKYAEIRERLALPSLGSFLWLPTSTGFLNAPSIAGSEGAELSNADFLDAIRFLAFTRKGKVLRPVDYKNLASEEVGGVYESLLSLTPQLSGDGSLFTFAEFAGNERKTSGSYYTPDVLVQCLLDSALEPVVQQAIKGKTSTDAERALLSLKVCDPAVGSGHFLVGAAHRLARHLARVRAVVLGESEPSPPIYQSALRDVIGHCLYGVDISPMAAELCKFSLWLDALEPGKPLSFLDHHIRIGNSLLGTTPDRILQGIPDDAFKPIEGDDRKACTELKRQNRGIRRGLGPLFAEQDAQIQARLQDAVNVLDNLPDERPEDISYKEIRLREYLDSPEYLHKKLLADTWCAAFVIKKSMNASGRRAYGITQNHLNDLANNLPLPDSLKSDIEQLDAKYQFFHWHLAFPHVFANGGFDCVLGNPPWDKIQPEESKFFAPIRPDIADAPTAKVRKALIEGLPQDDPAAYSLWSKYKRQIDGTCHFLRTSNILRFTGDGNLNSYRIFTELATNLIASNARAGMVVQTGLATDESGKEFFDHLLSSGRLCRFIDFENRGAFFPEVHQQFRFCLITIQGNRPDLEILPTEFGWLLHKIDEINMPNRLVHLTAEDLLLFNPTSRTCPIFTSTSDLEVSRCIYHHGTHVMLNEDQRFAHIDFLGELFNMTRDSGLFFKDHTANSLRLYEAKFIHQFDHRFATSSRSDVSELTSGAKQDPGHFVVPKSFVEASAVRERTNRRGILTDWLFGFRSIASATNERTIIGAVLPFTAVGNSINLILGLTGEQTLFLLPNMNSFIFDFCARQKISGSNVNIWIYKQLPTVPLQRYAEACFWSGNVVLLRNWILRYAIELTYTAWDLESFACDCGYNGPPFCWDEDRRLLLRCELDAAFFHLYLGSEDEWGQESGELIKAFPTPRHAVDYIMETFPIIKRKDEATYGSYRTKDTILEIYDDMTDSIRTGRPYLTRLNPPPGPPADGLGNFLSLPEWQPGQPKPSDWPVHIHSPKGSIQNGRD